MITVEQIQEGLVIPLDKPRQWTSFQAVNKIKAVVRNRYGLKKFKIGHAGTLDPLATGLLLVCLGKATKTIPQLQDGDKVYTGTMVLGATTPCYDMERAIDQYYPFEHISPTLLDEKRKLFEGEIMQVPPMFSAVKVEGQRAYEIARAESGERRVESGERRVESGERRVESAPKAKMVKVYSFEITGFRAASCSSFSSLSSLTSLTSSSSCSSSERHLYDNPRCVVPEGLPQVDFRIHCGKGTYIRSIARDFGLALGSGAFLSALRREQVGQYTIDQAVTIDQIEPFFTE